MGPTMNPSLLTVAELREPFGRWLAEKWPDAQDLRVDEIESPKSGFSATTLFVPVRFRKDGRDHAEKVVLRIESPDPAIYPAQAPGLDVEIEIQYRVMEALTTTRRVPLAPLIGFESNARILGQPFFAMGHVEGNVTIENPPYTREGFFKEARAAERHAMIENGLRVLAEVHAIDWRAAGLEWLVAPGTRPGVLAQLDLWEEFGRTELRDRELPVFDAAARWLRDELPAPAENAFSWGDSRLGNIIFRGSECACITDFENAAIAPPEFDLGWWLMFDRTMHESVEIERLPGEPTREEQREIYAKFAGRDPGDTHYYEVLGAFRYAAIVVRVMNRGVERGLVPPDHLIWLKNPAAFALADLIGMERPE